MRKLAFCENKVEYCEHKLLCLHFIFGLCKLVFSAHTLVVGIEHTKMQFCSLKLKEQFVLNVMSRTVELS